ncbi:MAG TPA: hypothetical protein VFW11_23240 [Cyclobacteriaceae bacterium]|nr:hypothetical protein [Cyclobacteriaceae bacterium]
MAKLVISTYISGGGLWLFLNETVILQNSETLTLELKEDEEYVVHWFMNGAPGSSYSITISSPREAQFQLTRGIGKSGKDYGGFPFRT